MRKLARLCEHDSLHAHYVATSKKPQPVCPGGEFLPEGALVIERPEALEAIGRGVALGLVSSDLDVKGKWSRVANDIFAQTVFDALALASQVGESER